MSFDVTVYGTPDNRHSPFLYYGLTHLKEDSLVITPGDRADIILGALQANISSNYPRISGIILTGGLIPEEPILKLIEGLSQIVPIVSVEDGTFSVTNRIGAVKSHIYADSTQKIETSLAVFERELAFDNLDESIIRYFDIQFDYFESNKIVIHPESVKFYESLI